MKSLLSSSASAATHQMELPLQARAAAAVSREEVAELLRFLDGGDWVKARDFPTGWNERRIRAVANASKGRVISGQRGYKLTLKATDEEVRKSTGWMISQANEMRGRAIEILQVHHRRVGL